MNQAVLPAMLSGLRVLDLSRNLPGPFATRMLADLGATIIKVEPPEGDPTRPLQALFDALNHGKECRRIDFKDAGELQRLRDWAQDVDVVIDSFRPGVMQAMGLDHARLAQGNPKLVMVSITGYGQQGPWASKAGHDLNFMAMSGVLDQMRSPQGELALSNVQWGDMAGGSAMACMAVLAAVFEAQRSGRGRALDVSMAHGLHAHLVMPLATGQFMQTFMGRWPDAGEDLLNGALPCYNLYPTADGRTLAVGALEHKFWRETCAVFGREDWAQLHWQRGVLPHSPESNRLKAEVAGLIASRPLAVWVERFDAADCCVTPVLTLAEAQVHPLFEGGARLPWQEQAMPG